MTASIRGRAAEWAHILSVLKLAESGQGGMCLVTGDPGSGRSRFLAEATALARARDMTVASATADELTRWTPLTPLLSALGETVATLSEDGHSPAVPDLRLWLWQRLRDRLVRRCADGPLVIALDDLQWADNTTLCTLRVLVPDLLDQPIVWLLSRCAGVGGATLDLLFDALAEAGGRRLPLGPLTGSAIAEVVTDRTGGRPHPDLLALAAGAGGNPLLLVTLLDGLVQEHGIQVEAGVARLTSARLPERTSGIVRGQLSALHPDTVTMLEVGAVLGRSFTIADAAEALAQPITALLPAIRESVRAGVLVSAGEGFMFRHALVWQAVLETTPDQVRAALHVHIGKTLLASGGSVVRAAGHLMYQTRPGDTTVIDALTAAAVEVLPTSPHTAVELTGRALDLMPATDPGRHHLLATQLSALMRSGQLSKAAALARAWLAEHPDADCAPRTRCALATLLIMMGRADEGLVEAEKTLAEPMLSTQDRWVAEAVQLAALTALRDPDRLRPRAEAVLADPAISPVAAVKANAALANELWDTGNLRAGLDLARRAAEQAAALATTAPVGHPGVLYATKLATIGEYERAEHALSEADEQLRLGGDIMHAAPSELVAAWILLARGGLAEATARARKGLAMIDELGTVLYAPSGHAVLASIALCTGQLAEAAHQVTLPVSWTNSFNYTQYVWAAIRVTEARHGARQAVNLLTGDYADLLDESRCSLFLEPTAAAWLVRQARAVGDPDLAAFAVRRSEALRTANPAFPTLHAAALHAAGLAEADPALLGQAAAAHRDPWSRAVAFEDRAAALTASAAGSRSSVSESLERALASFETAGATHDMARILLRLKEIGAHFRRRTAAGCPTTGWASLTGTERTVADLVAGGLTNRQVADRMYLSPHTVHFHLSRVFRKLDITSRVDLARRYGELRSD